MQPAVTHTLQILANIITKRVSYLCINSLRTSVSDGQWFTTK